MFEAEREQYENRLKRKAKIEGFGIGLIVGTLIGVLINILVYFM